MDDLLHEIANCPNVCLARQDRSHPCHNIVHTQNQTDDFQLPEPWNGNLLESPILFISSNPSIGAEEDYPTQSWTKDYITDFFTNRFDGKKKLWVKDNRYVLLKDGTYSISWVRFWAAVGKRAEELLGRKSIYGVDFAITEVVHCKSIKEQGVSEAADECSRKYLLKILNSSHAKIIVILGSFARNQVMQHLHLKSQTNYRTFDVGGVQRSFVFLPHPSAYCRKTIVDNVSKNDFEELKMLLK